MTGTDTRSRPEALARCVQQVVVKVTGRPDLADDKRMNWIPAEAGDMIEDITYLDQMTDIPMHDEQGSRDRPYDLIAHVNPLKLSARLNAMRLRPWLARPTLLALITVTARDGNPYPLTGDGNKGERQRQAIVAAGKLYGLRISLPSMTDIAATALDKLTPRDLPIGSGGPTAILKGVLRWSDQDFGWVADWNMQVGGKPEQWQVRGVSFDEAFRSGIGGAALGLSRRSGPR